MSASFTPEERRLQKLVLAKGDPTGTGVLTGEAAVKIFAESNLPPATLGGIWALADVENNGYLTGRGLLIALRLIGWAQSGDEDPNEMLIKKAGPLAKLPSFSSISESLNPFSPPILPNTAAGRAPQLTPEDRSKFIRLFNTIKPVNGFITGE
ncbi:hypothetical protein FRC03_001131 [Tulasnella sp. 419]|nr:hypothetical protein FRC02_000771 [Tulasnella sp. 418]KAG8964980.1 hypothetical protein FRC03_001131 [Tulasnella sp. 419]